MTEIAGKISRRARYEDLFERMLDPVFLLSSDDFTILECNPSAESVFGVHSSNRKNLSEWLSADKREEFEKMLRAARRSYHPRRIRLAWNLSQGAPAETGTERYFDALIGALSLSSADAASQESVVQVILRDVTSEVRAREELEILSVLDEMTRIPNYRRFKFELEREHERCVIAGGTYSIVFCDVDHFKQYNDREGHPAGDALLRELAQILRSQCRASDLPARYGGEEFAVLCRSTPGEGAMIFAERLRNAVETHAFAGGDRQPLGRLSLSIGVATYPENAQTPQGVLNAADKALYVSKKNGRNRVTRAQ